MLETILFNPEGLFSRNECDLLLGELNIELPPLKSISTYFVSSPKHFSIRSFFILEDNLRIPNELIQNKLGDDYNIKCSNYSQMVISKDGVDYILSIVMFGGRNSFKLSVQKEKTNIDDFKITFENYGKIMNVVFDSLFESQGKEIPHFKYYVGSIFSTQSKSPEDPNKLESFEKIFEIENPNVLFDQIGGCKIGKEEMQRIFDDIVHPEIARFFGRDPEDQKGYLLLGEPGNGKAILVKALATKLKAELDGRVKFYSINYSDITSQFRGGEAQATAEVFKLVEESEKKGIKTLLFLDEIHAIGQRKHQYNEALDTLLTKLAGMKEYKGLVIIGATSHPLETLDSALVREGRFGTHIYIEKPTKEERQEIFSIYINKMETMAKQGKNNQLYDGLDLDKLAKETEGYNGNDIYAVVKEIGKKREDLLKDKIRGGKSFEDAVKEVQPITTDDILQVIKSYRREERQITVGFQ